MSNVIAAPEVMTAAATDLATIGSTLDAAHMAAAGPTLAVMPAAADEVSASIAHLFSAHAQEYQALAGRAAAFQEQFVQHLTASARSFAHAEAANTALLQPSAASAGSIGSAIGAFWDQLVNLLNAAVGQLSTLLTGFQNMLTNLWSTLLTLGVAIAVLAFIFVYAPLFLIALQIPGLGQLLNLLYSPYS
jgi:hypothetical protein